MAPRTRKPVAKRRSNHASRDGDGTEEHGQQQNEQEPDLEVREVMARSTRSAIASRTARSGFLGKLQMMENQQQLQPQVFPQAVRGQGIGGPRTQKGTGSQSVYHGLEEMDQMEGGGQYQNEEEPDFQTTKQTNGRQVTAPRSQRSTVNRRLNHGYLEEDEMEVNGQQENEPHTNLEVTDALKNALQILMASGPRRAITNQNSHSGFQDNHQRQENGQWQNKRQMRPPISQQAFVMTPTPTTRKATRSHLGYHRLRDEIQMEGDGQQQDEEQPDFQMTRQVTAVPSTRRSTAKRKLNQGLLDMDEIEEQGHLGNEQPNLEFTQEIENALKILMAPSTRRAITNINLCSGFQDENQIKENGQLQNRKQPQPQISRQASVIASRNREATTNQSRYHNRLQDEDQMERDRQHQNEEQLEFRMTRQTKDQQVMTRSTRRSAAGRRVNNVLHDEDEIEEHGQLENEQLSDVEVTQAIENALKILMEPSIRRATTNENSHRGFQDMHQMKESRQQPQPQVSQQASISAVMPPRSQNATRNQSAYHRLRDEDQMEGDEEQQNEEPQEMQMDQQANDKKGSVKRARGPTLLRKIWGRNPDEERIKINFNKRGQPIGPNKKKFTGFLGTLARNGKYAPLDIDDWRKVPKENKDEMIKLVKERFEIPEHVEHWILLSIGRKRNSWKSRVKAQCFSPTMPINNKTHKPPPRVNQEQWKNLVSYWANEDVMQLCERNKINRQQSVMLHTTGKFSFAEMEEKLRERLGRSPTRVEMFSACFTNRDGNPSTHEVGVALSRMREYQSKLPQGSEDPVRPDDSFAKVIGHDPPGKVRMLGLGANPSDLWGGTLSRGTCLRMVLESQAAMARMEEKMDRFSKLVGSLQERMQPEQMQMQPEQNPNDVPPTRTPISPNQSSNSNFVGHKLQVGVSVLLKSLFDQKKIVAKGCLESVNPDQYVGGRRLGSNWYGVQISVPIEWDEDLIRPFSNFSTIGDAVGNCVAWPHHLVTSEDIQE